MNQGVFKIAGLCALTVVAFACSSDKSKSGAEPDAASGGATGTGGAGGASNSGGSSGAGTGGSTDGGSTGGSAGGGTDAGVLTLKGKVVSATVGELNQAEPPLAGAKVCAIKEDGTPAAGYTCTTTASDGIFSFGPLTPKQHLIVEVTMTGYSPAVKAIDVGTASINLSTTSIRLAAATDAGGANFGWDPAVALVKDAGTTNFFAVGPLADGGAGIADVAGVSVTIAPKSGAGPFYLDAKEAFRPGATTTGGGGYGGWFINLPAGEYVLTFSHPTLSCAPIAGSGYGWPEGANSVRVPILASLNTQTVGVYCTPRKDAGP